MRSVFYWICCSTCFLFACKSSHEKKAHFFYDYEQALGWIDAELEKGVAHSGTFSQKIAANREYSHGFSLPLSQLAEKPSGKLQAEVWVTAVSVSAPVKFVMDVVAPASNKHFKTVYEDVQPILQDSKGWKKITASIDLGGLPLDEPYFVKVYIWNNQQQQLWMDDLSVQLIKP